MSKPKCDWTVWFWNGTYWEKAATFHSQYWPNPKREAQFIAERFSISRNHRVLPAGREPKGKPL